MAILTALPSLDIISGFKGTIDFYLWMGIPVARSWPRSPGHDRAPAVEAQWPAFRIAATAWDNLDEATQDAYRHMAAGTDFTGRDMFARSYLSGLFAYPTGP